MVKVQLVFGNSSPVDYELSRDVSLKNHVENICTLFSVSQNKVHYTLMLEPTLLYLSDQNLLSSSFEIPQHSIIRLKLLPSYEADVVIDSLKLKDKKTIFELKVKLKDAIFATEFIRRGGFSIIVSLIQETSGNTLAYALSALDASMGYGMGWRNLNKETIEKLVSFLDSNNINVQKSALEVLTSLTKAVGYYQISKSLELPDSRAPYSNIMKLLGSTDLGVALQSLTLITELIVSVSNFSDRKSLFMSLDKSGVNEVMKKQVQLENIMFKKMVYKYQRLRLNWLKHYFETPYDKTNKEHEALLMRLWTCVYPDQELTSRVSEQWKLLGFQGTDPSTDFRGMGLLGLKQLLYFAEAHTDELRKIVLEQASRQGEKEYPVAVAGINLSRMLCDLFMVDKDVVDENGMGKIFPILFDHVAAFDEIYCSTFKILDFYWDEMQASYLDFPLVIATVKKQVSDVLAQQPATIASFNRGIATKNKSSLSDLEEDDPCDPKPIKVLKAKVLQEAINLVKINRIDAMKEGAIFFDYKPPDKVKKDLPKAMFYKLNESATEILYSVCDGVIPTDFNSSIKMSDCKEVLIGTAAPMFNKTKKTDEHIASLFFSLVLKDGNSVDFLCSSKEHLINWADGLKLMIGQKIEMQETIDTVRALYEAEIETKMIDLEGLAIPNDAPVVPPPPPHLHFYYKNTHEPIAILRARSRSLFKGSNDTSTPQQTNHGTLPFSTSFAAIHASSETSTLSPRSEFGKAKDHPSPPPARSQQPTPTPATPTSSTPPSTLPSPPPAPTSAPPAASSSGGSHLQSSAPLRASSAKAVVSPSAPLNHSLVNPSTAAAGASSPSASPTAPSRPKIPVPTRPLGQPPTSPAGTTTAAPGGGALPATSSVLKFALPTGAAAGGGPLPITSSSSTPKLPSSPTPNTSPRPAGAPPASPKPSPSPSSVKPLANTGSSSGSGISRPTSAAPSSVSSSSATLSQSTGLSSSSPATSGNSSGSAVSSSPFRPAMAGGGNLSPRSDENKPVSPRAVGFGARMTPKAPGGIVEKK